MQQSTKADLLEFRISLPYLAICKDKLDSTNQKERRNMGKKADCSFVVLDICRFMSKIDSR
jgi:hypothetical protein